MPARLVLLARGQYIAAFRQTCPAAAAAFVSFVSRGPVSPNGFDYFSVPYLKLARIPPLLFMHLESKSVTVLSR